MSSKDQKAKEKTKAQKAALATGSLPTDTSLAAERRHAAIKNLQHQQQQAEAALKLRLANARGAQEQLNDRILDKFTAEEMQDPQGMNHAAAALENIKGVREERLGELYKGIGRAEKAERVLRRARK